MLGPRVRQAPAPRPLPQVLSRRPLADAAAGRAVVSVVAEGPVGVRRLPRPPETSEMPEVLDPREPPRWPGPQVRALRTARRRLRLSREVQHRASATLARPRSCRRYRRPGRPLFRVLPLHEAPELNQDQAVAAANGDGAVGVPTAAVTSAPTRAVIGVPPRPQSSPPNCSNSDGAKSVKGAPLVGTSCVCRCVRA